MYIKKLIYLGLFIYLPLTSCSQKNNTTSPIAENNKHAITQEKVISNPANNSGWLINYEDVYNQSVEQNKPMFTPGVANFADSDDIAKSHDATNWHPAAVATPSTSAITGFGD